MTKETLKSASKDAKIPKATLREQRRAARAARLARQRAIVSGVILLAVVALALYIFRDKLFGQAPQTGAPTEGGAITTASGLQYEDLVVGEGTAAVAGDTVSVHYTGWLEDGTQFDSSVDRGVPYEFILGVGSVIPGWDEGVAGMQVGGTRKLIIPPDLAYGAGGSGGVIPPNATLVFEVQLLEIK